MRIGLDARTVYRAQRRGTGKNLIDLYTHLSQVRPDWRVIAYHRAGSDVRDVQTLLPTETVTPKRIEMPGDRYDAWMRLRLPLAARRDRLDVLHCPANLCPSWMPVPTMVTIHDLIPLDGASDTPAAQRRRYEAGVRTGCRKAAMIVTPSEFTRGQLIKRFGADPSRVMVNAWAADSRMRTVAAPEYAQVLLRYGVARPFVLHMGAADPRKNTLRVLQAWAMSELAQAGCCQLLIIGLNQPTAAKLRDLAVQLGVANTVRLTGFAAEEDMPALCSAAELILYPSLAEGFGLPILDAWAAGTPILTSDTTSLPEVAGDAAALVDPHDACAISRMMIRVLRDRHTRLGLVQRGRERLKQFTWQATAERFAQAIERAAAHRAPGVGPGSSLGSAPQSDAQLAARAA